MEDYGPDQFVCVMYFGSGYECDRQCCAPQGLPAHGYLPSKANTEVSTCTPFWASLDRNFGRRPVLVR